MKKALVLFFLCLTLNANAQWTLDNCIKYAIEHNISIKQMEISQRAAKTDLTSAQMAFLPDLNAGAGQNWNFGRTQLSSGLYENQTQSNTSFSISSSMPIFTGGRLINSAGKAKLDLQMSVFNLQKAKNDISLQVTSLFFEVLFQKELLKIAKEQFLTTKQQVSITTILTRSGKVPQSQLFDIQSQIANDTLSVVQANNNLKLALLDLTQMLELQNIEDFDIISPNIETENYLLQTPQEIYKQALTSKAEIKSAEISLKSAEKSLKIANASYFPTLSLSAGVSTSYFYLYNNAQNSIFKDQINANLGEYIGLNLSIPIFNRFSVVNQSKQAKFNIENQKLVLENAKKQLFKEIQTAYLNALSANEKQNAAIQAVTAAQEAFRYNRERYKNGKLSVFEFSQSQFRLSQAQAEEAQAKFDYMFKIKVIEFYKGK
ncbi:MAG: TolC family protein [Bacteroidales bacterium]|jgi:outer membrane protein|nr:TolC family protein [Bacteroidales bacterium]